jgi:hypothetical protein
LVIWAAEAVRMTVVVIMLIDTGRVLIWETVRVRAVVETEAKLVMVCRLVTVSAAAVTVLSKSEHGKEIPYKRRLDVSLSGDRGRPGLCNVLSITGLTTYQHSRNRNATTTLPRLSSGHTMHA